MGGGPQGERGIAGINGIDGGNGTNGIDGQDGAQGSQGSQGEPGQDGAGGTPSYVMVDGRGRTMGNVLNFGELGGSFTCLFSDLANSNSIPQTQWRVN